MFSRRVVSVSARFLSKSAKDGSVKNTASEACPTPAPKKAPKAAAAAPVVESKGDTYMVPEYFQHDRDSYSNSFLQMAAYRCPQKSNTVPDEPQLPK